jgi:uncharacterized protein (TIGR00255 family)
MTGYGRAIGHVAGYAVTVQVSSVNRRSLDLTVSLPEEWESLEPAVAEEVRKVASRGKVHVEVEAKVTDGGEEAAWDEAGVRNVLKRLAALAAAEGISFHPTPELLWEVASSSKRATAAAGADLAKEAILEALARALHEFAVMRAKEGEALLVDFLARVAALRRLVESVAARSPHVVPAYRETLLKRLREAGLELDLSDERVLKEIALFADRCDTTEEITRLRSHLDQLSHLLRSDGEIGRKGEFLLQEMGREVHTVGSKANDLAIARSVIELKNELEKVREQMANVE